MKRFIITNLAFIAAIYAATFFDIYNWLRIPVLATFHIQFVGSLYIGIFAVFISLYCLYKVIMQKSIIAALLAIPLALFAALILYSVHRIYIKKDLVIQTMEAMRQPQDSAPANPALQYAVNSNTTAHITDLNSPEDLTKFITSHEYAVIKCSAEWCPPCKAMKPIVENAAIQFADTIAFAHIDDQKSPALSASLDIQGLPTFVCYKNGTEVNRFVGYKSKAEFETELNKLVATS